MNLRKSTFSILKLGPAPNTNGTGFVTNLSAVTLQIGLHGVAGFTSFAPTGTNWAHAGDGWYDVAVPATNLATVGEGLIELPITTNSLGAYMRFDVLPADVYDALYAGGTFSANVNQMGGSSTAVTTLLANAAAAAASAAQVAAEFPVGSRLWGAGTVASVSGSTINLTFSSGGPEASGAYNGQTIVAYTPGEGTGLSAAARIKSHGDTSANPVAFVVETAIGSASQSFWIIGPEPSTGQRLADSSLNSNTFASGSGGWLIDKGTLVAGGSGTVQLATTAGTSSLSGKLIVFNAGPGSNQAAVILSSTTNRVATLGRSLSIAVTGATGYYVLPAEAPVINSLLRVDINDRTGISLSGADPVEDFIQNATGVLTGNYSFSAAALSNAASASFYLTPYTIAVNNPRFATRDFPKILTGSAPADVFTVVDDTGTAINLSAKTVRFVVFSRATNTACTEFDDTLTKGWQYQTGGSGVTVGTGTNTNQVTVQHAASNNATAGPWEYELWNVTDKLPLARGKMPIVPGLIGT